jgi:Domain of unknown function (DUF6259)
VNRRSVLKSLGLTTGLALAANPSDLESLAQPTGSQPSAQVSAPLPPPAGIPIRTIETPLAILRLSERSGDLIGITWKNPRLDLIHDPRLGENFRILLPRPGYEAAYFNSRDQQVTRIEPHADGVDCFYDSLTRTASPGNDSETVSLQVRYSIRAVGGQLLFSIQVANPTDRKLAEIMYGILGGQHGIADRLATESIIPGTNTNLAPRIFSQFRGGGYGGGNLGIRYDAATFSYPGQMPMGWMDVYNPSAGIGYYYANHDPALRLKLLALEMRPFTKSASLRDNWPTPAEAAGEPLGVTMGWVAMPYASNGTFTTGPAALQVHRGDWHTASHIYRSWFDQHFTIKRPRSWLRRQQAWQSIILSNSEDVIVHRFSELPKLAADAKKYNITNFEILGWDIGGIDRGYPQYQPDPRLGTPDEFRSALASIRALGVHPLIFSNIQEADTATPLFRDKLRQYAVEGRWAPDLRLNGWGEGTITARYGLTRSNMTLVSAAHPEFRKFLISQYLELVRQGAAGFQFDKTNMLDVLDFNPHLPVAPDESLIHGLLSTFQELIPQARAIDPSFALASETWFDRALPYVDVSYMRMGLEDMDSTSLRYTFPEWTATIFGESPGDFGPMNNGMRYGMVWALAPRHYNDSVDELLTRPLARYVQELMRIRTKYADLLFYGRFNDTLGATVRAGADVRYSVFTPAGPTAKSRACVVVNFADTPQSAEVHIDGAAGEATVAIPFQPERTTTLPASLTIPPRQLAVVVA